LPARLLRRLLHQHNNAGLFIKTNDRRHIFYYAHLNALRTDAIPRSVLKLETAAMTNPANDLPVGANPVAPVRSSPASAFSSVCSLTLHFGISTSARTKTA